MADKQTMAPVHPGEILKEEFLEPLGLTAGKLAVHLGVPSQRLYDLIAGKRGVTLDTALRLGKFFGSSHELWLGLQEQYEYQCAEDAGLIARVEAEVRPLAREKRLKDEAESSAES